MKEIQLKMDRHRNIKHREYSFNFKREILKKFNRTKNTVDKKITIAFNFTKEKNPFNNY